MAIVIEKGAHVEDVAGLEPLDQLGMMADIVSAYVSNNNVSVADLPQLIASTHAALAELAAGPAGTGDGGPDKATPAQIKKSITPDLLVSFEDGKPYKTLRRHLTLRGLTPEAYRAKWGLPGDYPMTSANYSAHRSQLARDLGLGQQRRKSYAKAATVAETVTDAPKDSAKDGAKDTSKSTGRAAAKEAAGDAAKSEAKGGAKSDPKSDAKHETTSESKTAAKSTGKSAAKATPKGGGRSSKAAAAEAAPGEPKAKGRATRAPKAKKPVEAVAAE